MKNVGSGALPVFTMHDRFTPLFVTPYFSVSLGVIPKDCTAYFYGGESSSGAFWVSPAALYQSTSLVPQWTVLNPSEPIHNNSGIPQFLYRLAVVGGASLYQFGSRVRGNATPWSDSDYMVVQPDDGTNKEFRHGYFSVSNYRMATLQSMASKGSFFTKDVLLHHSPVLEDQMGLALVQPFQRKLNIAGRYMDDLGALLSAMAVPAIYRINPGLTSAKLAWCARTAVFCRGHNPFTLDPQAPAFRSLKVLCENARAKGLAPINPEAVVVEFMAVLQMDRNFVPETIDDIGRRFDQSAHPDFLEIAYQLCAADRLSSVQ